MPSYLGSSSNDNIVGSIYDDVIYGFDGNDVLIGGNGDDYLLGGLGDDIFDGGAGSDAISCGLGLDIVDGGDGIDLASVDFSDRLPGIAVDFSVGGLIGFAGGGSIQNVEYLTITGTSGDDTFRAMNASAVITFVGLYTVSGDEVFAGAGNDTVYGGDGNDILRGEDGNDRLEGEFGNDVLIGGNGNDYLLGGLGNDIFDGGSGLNTFLGGAGDDTYKVTVSTDGIVENSGEGVDLAELFLSNYTLAANVENASLLLNANSNVTGNSSSNVLTGNNFNNTLVGVGGDDVLVGLAGNDTLNGGLGNDTITGGIGRDILTGGAGNDTLVFLASGESAGSITDRITDFQDSDGGSGFSGFDDLIDLSAIDANVLTAAAGNQAFTFIGTSLFTGAAGELRVFNDATNNRTVIQGNTNTSISSVEFQFYIDGQQIASQIAASDFVL
jgi:Ca2+-binding RTX toxin-like protein